MDLFNSEGGKLRKKDKVTYYKDEKGKLTEIPKMTDEKEKVFSFLRMCVLRSVKNVTDKEIEDAWTLAEEKKELILSSLQQMKDEAEASGENTYKVIAYVKAIKALKAIKVPVLSGDQAQKLDGIGPGIAGVISQVLREGRLKTQEERIEGMASRQPIIDRFMGIWDVKAKTASQWYNKGHKELEDLVGEELTDKQKLGIKYYEDLQKKISRKAVDNAVEDLRAILGDGVVAIGPYRTGAEEVDVIEVLILPSATQKTGKAALKQIVGKLDRKLQKSLTLVDVEMSDLKPTKFSGICHLRENYYRIEINLIPKGDVGLFLLFSTGPKTFIANIKEQAAVLDYRLDKKGLVKISVDDDEAIDTPTEQSIFEAIGMDYIEPQNRS